MNNVKQLSVNPLKTLYNSFIVPSCTYFSICVYLTTLVYYTLYESYSAVDVQPMLWFWIYAMAEAVAGLIFLIPSLITPFKVLLHWLMSVTLMACVLFWGSDNISSSTIIGIVAIFSLAYFLLYGIYVLGKKLIPQGIKERFLLQFPVYFAFSIWLSVIICYAVEVADCSPHFINLQYYLLFAAILSISGNIYKSRYGLFFKLVLHYVICTVSFVAIYFGLAHGFVNYIDILLTMVVMTVIYFFIASVTILIAGKIKKNDIESVEYDKQFRG